MDRTYTLTVHRDERVGALLTARLYRVDDGGAAALVAEIDPSYAAFGVGDVLERLTDQLIDHKTDLANCRRPHPQVGRSGLRRAAGLGR